MHTQEHLPPHDIPHAFAAWGLRRTVSSGNVMLQHCSRLLFRWRRRRAVETTAQPVTRLLSEATFVSFFHEPIDSSAGESSHRHTRRDRTSGG